MTTYLGLAGDAEGDVVTKRMGGMAVSPRQGQPVRQLHVGGQGARTDTAYILILQVRG